ncbi:MAG TPA: DNA polymerase A family protein, partial [Candidatus Omnitrophota bacterium]|nr:DNA polymerase A family protein [Candidatus Omnitrophota bacterium]
AIVKAREQGYVTTLLCRRRYLPEIHNANMGLRQFAERQAINTPVQGTAADLIKLAMVNIDRLMTQKKMSSTMILTVHDELVFDVPQKEIGLMASLVRTEMEGVIKLSVPVKATVKTGPNWLEMATLS